MHDSDEPTIRGHVSGSLTFLGAAGVGERSEPDRRGPGPERPVAVGDKSGVKPPGGEWHAPYPLAP